MADNLKQVIVNVNAKDFIVKCSEECKFLEDDIALISGVLKIELKRFVDAFVKKVMKIIF